MGTAAEERSHSTVDAISLVPALAATAPHKRLVYLVRVPSEGLDLILSRLHALDVFSRELVDPLREVIARPVEGLHERSMPAETVGAHHHKVIRHVRDGDRDVRLWIVDPELGEVHSASTDDWKAWAMRYVETRGADDCDAINEMKDLSSAFNESLTNVALKYLSIRCVYRMSRDLGGRAVGQMAIRSQKRFKIAGTWSDPTTSQLPLRYELLAEVWVMVQLLRHLRCGCSHTFLVVLPFDEDVERLVCLGDDLFAMLEVSLRVMKAPFVVLRVPGIRIGVVSSQML